MVELDAKDDSSEEDERQDRHIPLSTPRRLCEDKGFTPTSLGSWTVGSIIVLIALGAGLMLLFSSLLYAQLCTLIATVGLCVGSWYIMVSITKDVLLQTYGALVGGTIERWEEDRVHFVYADPLGGEVRTSLYAETKKHQERLPPGQRVMVLVDPTNPSTSQLVELMHGFFEEQEPAEDHRPPRPAGSSHGRPEEAFGVHELLWSLEPVAANLQQAIIKSRKPYVVGELVVDEEQIAIGLPWKKEPVALSWSTPFSVVLSAWLVDSDKVRLALSLRPRGMVPGQACVSFQTELPQRCVSREVPFKVEASPMLRPEDFAKVWALVCAQAGAHGVNPSRLVGLGEGGVEVGMLEVYEEDAAEVVDARR